MLKLLAQYHFLFSLVLLLCNIKLHAQITAADTTNQEVAYIGGLNNLAVQYYGIEFSKAQRALLKDKVIEFIYQIDEQGHPTLSEINGISDAAILDSLKRKTLEIGKFQPRIINGVPSPSIYFVQLTWPTYRRTTMNLGLMQFGIYNEANLEDFEYIEKSNYQFDWVIGGVMNQFIGQPAQHLQLGGGMHSDFSFTDKRKLIYGFQMDIYFNKLKKDFPISTTREQVSKPLTGVFGFFFGKWYNRFNAQLGVNFAIVNLSEKLNEDDQDWIQLEGWSPSILLNYPILLGKENTAYSYGTPMLFRNNLNLHVGLRYLHYDLKEASGMMAEIGVAYRMTLMGVKSYKLKREYLERHQ